MRKISADKIYTIENGVIEKGVVILDKDNTIIEISDRSNFENAELEIYHGDICPGFINAHCHLELSHLKNKITPHGGLVNFIEQLLKIRFEISPDERLQLIAEAEHEMIENGIIAVGDISNESITIPQKRKRNLYYHTFIESVGLNPSIAEARFIEAQKLSEEFSSFKLVNTLAPHAPYSTSIELQQLIYNLNTTSTIHSQESIEEEKFFDTKSGEFINFYKNLLIDISFFNATKQNSLQSNIKVLPTISNMLFVHNTFANSNDLTSIFSHNSNSYLCTCINANLFIENNIPNIKMWLQKTKNICIGTDSLASNKKLSVWDEIKTIQSHFPDISLHELLSFATINGARFLGIDGWAGSIKIGKKPSLNLISNATIKKIA